MTREVSSDSTRLIIATSPAAELTTRKAEPLDEETVKFAVAFETAEVDMYRADAWKVMNICGTMSAPSGAGPSVDIVGTPSILDTFQAPLQSGSTIKAVALQRNGV